MARISTYNNDTTINGTDRLLGTDSNGGLNSTSNITLDALKDYVNSGIDIPQFVPRLNIPAVDADSTGLTYSSIYQTVTPQNVDIEFYNTDPGGKPNAEIAKGTFRFYNSGDAYYFEVIDYASRYNIHSFPGKNINATAGSAMADVTATIGEISQIDGKDYQILPPAMPGMPPRTLYRFNMTRTGDLTPAGTWARITESTPGITYLGVLAANNTTGMVVRTLDLIEVNVPSIVVESIRVTEEADFDKIPFEENDEGIIFQEEGKTNAVGIFLNTSTDRVVPFQEGYTTNGGVPSVVPRNRLAADASATTTYMDWDVDVFNFSDTIYTTTDSVATAEADVATNDNRDQTTLTINNRGISTTYFDGSAAGLIQPVSANNVVTYRKPATDSIAQGPQNEGVLTQLQIGSEYYTIPTSTSLVAQTLPGLSEELSPVPGSTSTVVSRRNIGRQNDTALVVNTNLPISTWAADEGTFELLDTDILGTLIPVVFSGDNFRAALTGSSGTLNVVTNSTAMTGVTYILLNSNDVEASNITAGDSFVIHNNAAGSTATLTFTVSSTLNRTVTTGGVSETYYIIRVTSPTYSGGAFDVPTTGVFQYSVTRPVSGSTINAAYWFYGVDHGTYVEFRSVITDRADISTQPTGVPALARGISQYVGAAGNVFNTNTIINTAYNNIPTGQKLFFREATLVAPHNVSGATVPGNNYEVVSYINNNGTEVASTNQATLVFSLIGQGSLVMSSPSVRITNLRPATDATPNIIVQNRVDNSLATISYSENALTQVMNYQNNDTATDRGTVTSFQFGTNRANDPRINSGGGALSVDVSGRIPIDTTGTVPRTTSYTIPSVWTAIIIGRVAPATPTPVRTLTLPSSTGLQAGDTVRIYDLSKLDADGDTVPGINWQVATPTATERIQRATTNLILNLPRPYVDLVWSGVDAVGWLIS